MRTTLTLDPDVAAKAKRGAAQLRKPFKEVINSALRVGLDEILKPAATKPYRTKPRPLGLRPGFSYDDNAPVRQCCREFGLRRSPRRPGD